MSQFQSLAVIDQRVYFGDLLVFVSSELRIALLQLAYHSQAVTSSLAYLSKVELIPQLELLIFELLF